MNLKIKQKINSFISKFKWKIRLSFKHYFYSFDGDNKKHLVYIFCSYHIDDFTEYMSQNDDFGQNVSKPKKHPHRQDILKVLGCIGSKGFR